LVVGPRPLCSDYFVLDVAYDAFETALAPSEGVNACRYRPAPTSLLGFIPTEAF
jgi:hypothetical protein